MKRASLLLSLLLVACGGDAPVHSDYNPSADFASYTSFSIGAPVIQAEQGSVARDPRVIDTIHRTIRDDLGSRPKPTVMSFVEQGGALSITVSIAAGDETGVDQWGATWSEDEGFSAGGDTFEFRAGTLVIDFFEEATGQLVWRGWAHSAVTRTSDPDLDYLANAVHAILANYPPTDGKE